jgi:23S rRNA (pseudouridine1915-N3)-methyltransferase
MKIRVLWLGKTRNAHLAAVCEDFIGRTRHFIGIDILQQKEPRIRDEAKRIEIEGERLLESITASDYVVVLDPMGQTYTSGEFAKFLGQHMSGNPRDLAFVVGGHAGLSAPVKERADRLWSLSALTYSHDLARTVLLEQIYRALTMLHNHPYAR